MTHRWMNDMAPGFGRSAEWARGAARGRLLRGLAEFTVMVALFATLFGWSVIGTALLPTQQADHGPDGALVAQFPAGADLRAMH